MVKALHRAGIEVILDVVYNHTAEGNHLGPMLSFKGVDNASYYRLMPDEPRFYMDFTGTGNSLNPVHPSVLRLIMDSLRYCVIECHVDGFRFDLASALAREFYEVDRLSTFFDTIHQDPVLSQVKLIAEPWDVGPGGYQVGNFPVLWAEWNGMYRDTMRDFWRGQRQPRRVRVALHRLERPLPGGRTRRRSRRSTSSPRTTASRCATSSRTTRSTTRRTARATTTAPTTTAPGTAASRATTDDPAINALRARQQRNFLATLLLSQGVPMLLGGDEIGRTQHGNNNAWCQDNEISWFDWERADGEPARVRAAADRLRREHPVFRRDDVPHRPRDARLGAARRLVVPPRRPADDADATGSSENGADARRLPERRGDPVADARTARRSSTTRSCSSSTRTPSRSRSRCRRGASGPAGRSSWRRGTRPPTSSSPPVPRSSCPTARCSCSGAPSARRRFVRRLLGRGRKEEAPDCFGGTGSRGGFLLLRHPSHHPEMSRV